ncbi:pseudouridine synthase [candidate division KSB1 bacterium]|nr:pseudouridine synthase [candidate division KSB1 bacterium]
MIAMRLLCFNKPFNVLCQFTDLAGRPTLADYVPVPSVYPAGRLDFDSEGLVLLTDAGWLQSHLSHPQFKLAKRYWVQVERQPDAVALQKLAHGVYLQDGRTQPARVKLIPEPKIWPRIPPVRFRKTVATSWLELEIVEGRNRQVRRITAAVGFPTLRLIRGAIGPWELGDLLPGEWKEVPCPRNLREFYVKIKNNSSRSTFQSRRDEP